MRVYLLILSLFFCSITFAQNTISGSVTDSSNQPISGANVKIVGTATSTVTDFDGSFSLKLLKSFPLAIEISIIGFETRKISVPNNQKVIVKLNSEQTQLNEIVVSASRTPERIKESPVTIERMGIKDIKKSASATFYDGLENLKEVQINTSSLGFKSVNTRGFAAVSNARFLQLVDGMDNASPALNFVLGNLIGLSEIDVQSVELLPGSSSALYGANAFNGALFLNSKNPFTYQGISGYAKNGITDQKASGSNYFYDYGIRVAHAFSPYFAGKANFAILNGTDWAATDTRDLLNPGRDRSHQNYDGLNIYGDEVSTNIKAVGNTLARLGLLPAAAVNLLPNENVSRTGYAETDLVDNKVKSVKIDFALHFRPLGNENLEIIWASKFGYGNAIYQGANRYNLNNFFMQQHKLEIKGKNFFIRGYLTDEDAGTGTHDTRFTGINVNRAWKPDATWFGQYAGAFVQASLAGQTPENAHIAARNVADAGRLIPGTAAFKSAFNKVIADANVLTGSRLQDQSKLYHADANYNFKDIVKFVEIQVGGSAREYQLNSGGRIYTDADGPIRYSEFGAYTQVTKKLLADERLKLTASIRYDKSKNFDGNYSPRISFVYSAGPNKTHTFRGSFQTGFRNPTTQDQYIGFNVGNAQLVGSAVENLNRFKETLPVATPVGQAFAGGTTVVLTGQQAYNNSYTVQSVRAFGALAAAGNIVGAAALLKKAIVPLVKPETVKAFDLGYRAEIHGVSIDLNGYYNIYNDFLGNVTALAPLYGVAQDAPNPAGNPLTDLGTQTIHAIANGNTRAYQLYTNTNLEIKSLGAGIGLTKKIFGNYEIGANYNYAEFNFDRQKAETSFEAGFNTPKHKVKASIGNDKLFKNFGFNISGRWYTSYLWESSFADGIIPSATVVDAQVSYNIRVIKSILKIGATNIGGKEYNQVLGAGLIGQQYFASLTIKP